MRRLRRTMFQPYPQALVVFSSSPSRWRCAGLCQTHECVVDAHASTDDGLCRRYCSISRITAFPALQLVAFANVWVQLFPDKDVTGVPIENLQVAVGSAGGVPALRERERERELQCFGQPTSLIAFAREPGHIFRILRQSRTTIKKHV